jgi:hypothetical protein
MRVAPAIHLSTEARAELQNLVRRRTTPVSVVERCRIVLLAAARTEGENDSSRHSGRPFGYRAMAELDKALRSCAGWQRIRERARSILPSGNWGLLHNPMAGV